MEFTAVLMVAAPFMLLFAIYYVNNTVAHCKRAIIELTIISSQLSSLVEVHRIHNELMQELINVITDETSINQTDTIVKQEESSNLGEENTKEA